MRTDAYDTLLQGKADFQGALNFSAYRQGHDPQYLGVNGINYYAKPWGNDSSNVQSIMNAPAYWKRVYNRDNVAARFASQEREPTPLKRSMSDGAMQRLPREVPKDSYADIKASMKPFAERQGKPKIRAMEHGERLEFFNTLGNKYHLKAGGKNLTWNVNKETHRSSPNELRWILSNYFRTDTQAVLAGAGSDPNLAR